MEITNDEREPRHHYLKGLEGCSFEDTRGVQSAFEDLYGLLRTLLDDSLQTGQVTALERFVLKLSAVGIFPMSATAS